MQVRQSIDWHGVTFLACLGVAIVLMVYQGLSRDGRIHTLFEADQRRALARYVQRHVYDYRQIEGWFNGSTHP